jgi:hypothetical protein
MLPVLHEKSVVLEKLSSELDLDERTDGLRLTEEISSAEE